MSAYRWAASSGLFFGSISTVLLLEEMLHLLILSSRCSFAVFLGASLMGVAASLVALFLHREEEAVPTLLGHRAAAFIGIALSSWPWVLMVWLNWFLAVGPP